MTEAPQSSVLASWWFNNFLNDIFLFIADSNLWSYVESETLASKIKLSKNIFCINALMRTIWY